MNYLIAVYPNEVEALSARTALENESLPSEQISIVGEGFKSTDDYGLIKPERQARNNPDVAYWLVPIGFACGYAFSLLANIEIIPAGSFPNQFVGGLLVAVFVFLLASAVGNKFGLNVNNDDSWLYRDRLNAGKYLIVFHGTDELVKKATSTLHSFEVENV
ncbi:MAG: hypothetical protein AAF630_05645 [Cyanobacteria bacterium P01_C01_bin.38]